MHDDVIEEATLCDHHESCVLLFDVTFFLLLEPIDELVALLLKHALDENRHRLQLCAIRPPMALNEVDCIDEGLCLAQERLLEVVSVYESKHYVLCLILSLLGLNSVQEVTRAFEPGPHAFLIVEAFEVP